MIINFDVVTIHTLTFNVCFHQKNKKHLMLVMVSCLKNYVNAKSLMNIFFLDNKMNAFFCMALVILMCYALSKLTFGLC